MYIYIYIYIYIYVNIYTYIHVAHSRLGAALSETASATFAARRSPVADRGGLPGAARAPTLGGCQRRPGGTANLALLTHTFVYLYIYIYIYMYIYVFIYIYV